MTDRGSVNSDRNEFRPPLPIALQPVRHATRRPERRGITPSLTGVYPKRDRVLANGRGGLDSLAELERPGDQRLVGRCRGSPSLSFLSKVPRHGRASKATLTSYTQLPHSERPVLS